LDGQALAVDVDLDPFVGPDLIPVPRVMLLHNHLALELGVLEQDILLVRKNGVQNPGVITWSRTP
jgi:hypothetical protein